MPCACAESTSALRSASLPNLRLGAVEILRPVAVVAGVVVTVGAGVRVVGVVDRRRDPQRVDAEVREVAALDLLLEAGEVTALVVARVLDVRDVGVVRRVTVGEAVDHDEVHDRVAPVHRGPRGAVVAVDAHHRVVRAVAIRALARVVRIGDPVAVDDELVDDHLLVVRRDRRLEAARDRRHVDAGGPAIRREVAVQRHAGRGSVELDRGRAARHRWARRARIAAAAAVHAAVRIVALIRVLRRGTAGEGDKGGQDEESHGPNGHQGPCQHAGRTAGVLGPTSRALGKRSKPQGFGARCDRQHEWPVGSQDLARRSRKL